MEAVDILVRIDPDEHLLGVEMPGQRQLDEDAVDRGIGVERIDQRQQIRLEVSAGSLCSKLSIPPRGSSCPWSGHRPRMRGPRRPAPPPARARARRCRNAGTSSAIRARNPAAKPCRRSMLHSWHRAIEAGGDLRQRGIAGDEQPLEPRGIARDQRDRAWATPNCLATSAINAALAAPSTGGAVSFAPRNARRVPAAKVA
jgi:hypothetical protein